MKISVRLTFLAAALLCVLAHAGDAAKRIALDFDADGEHEASAVTFRRQALLEEDAQRAGQWYWFAAYAYARDNNWKLSNKMLDRAEDAAAMSVAVPSAWLRAENAMRERDWNAAVFHFDSMRFGAPADDLRFFAARGAAAAHLRNRDLDRARDVLGEYAGASETLLASIDRYAEGRDKKPWLGGVLGLVPGCGYLYSGEYWNATRSLLLNSLFIWGMYETGRRDQWAAFSVIGFFEATWYSGSVYGGIDAAQRHNRDRLDAVAHAIRGDDALRPDTSRIPLIALGFAF
ncbi:MAG: hypothetical protein FWG50_07730 [Kiritimatiellaeota bacterium]|nr:hypothetical protein [Kiritimatiellota bacterium]